MAWFKRPATETPDARFEASGGWRVPVAPSIFGFYFGIRATPGDRGMSVPFTAYRIINPLAGQIRQLPDSGGPLVGEPAQR
jgi:hypothetical protein